MNEKPSIKVELVNKPNKSTLQGRVEKLEKNKIKGWVQYSDDIAKTVEIDVYEDDVLLKTIQANQDTKPVGDIQDLGFCGFSFPIPKKLLTGTKHILKFVDHNNKQPLPGSPFKLGNGVFDSEFSIVNGSSLVGAIKQRTSSKSSYKINLSLDKKLFWSQEFKGGNLNKIKSKLPNNVFDGQNHSVQIKVLDGQDKTLMMTVRKVKHSYQGIVENVNLNSVTGWITNKDYPHVPVEIDLVINGHKTITAQCDIQRHDVQKKQNLDSTKVGFKVDLPHSVILNTSTNIEIFIKGTKNRILSKQYVLTPKDIIIRSLMTASEHLNSLELGQDKVNLSAGIQAEITANTLVRQQVIAPIIKQLRQQVGIPSKINIALNPVTQVPAFDKSPIVDIIIPVYKGYDETIACINSVLVARNITPSQLIVINDQSPDGKLSYKLQAMAKEKQFTLLENKTNLGFVGTANLGLSLHKDRDVILLNSDTEVYTDWLDRMVGTAKQDNNIATVTPFSNNATICSFPEFNQDNQIPSDVSAQQLDQLFSKLNQKKSVDLPTAVGFCMLIKREVLETIGYLDEKTWQKGYGEENDFCLKAATLGWRHVLASNIFVQHHGSVSFADSKEQWLEANLSKLNQRYPDYPATVQRFIQQDPIAAHRNPMIKQLILQQATKHLLFITHNLGGGTKTNTDKMVSLLKQQDHAVLELTAISQTQWELKDHTDKLCLKYNTPQDNQQLEKDLKELGVWRIHYHQLVGFPKQIWQLPKALSCAYDFTAHDFLPLCPRINMIDESGQHCGESQYDSDKCQRCVQMNGLPEIKDFDILWQQYDQSVSQWRKDFKQRLSGADNIFCPSKSTAKIYKSHYALKNIQLKAHPEDAFKIKPTDVKAEKGVINIALIGAIGDHKGSQLLLDCAKHALKEGLPLNFVLIGYSNIDEELNKLDNVTLTGEYKNPEQLKQKIQAHQCQMALFLSAWPETFCYTLTEALENNLYPVALNYGAIAERIKKLKFGMTLSTDLQAKEINKKLMSAAKKASKIEGDIEYKGAKYPDIIKDYYLMDV